MPHPDPRTGRRALGVLKQLPSEALGKAIESLVQLLPPSEPVSRRRRKSVRPCTRCGGANGNEICGDRARRSFPKPSRPSPGNENAGAAERSPFFIRRSMPGQPRPSLRTRLVGLCRSPGLRNRPHRDYGLARRHHSLRRDLQCGQQAGGDRSTTSAVIPRTSRN